MSRKAIILWTIGALLLAPFFGIWIWKEATSGDEDYVKNKLAENLPGAENSEKAAKSAAAKAPSAQAPAQAVPQTPKTPPPPAQEEIPEEPENKPEEKEKEKDEKADWKIYRSDEDKFEFKYPPGVTVGGGNGILTLEKEKKTWRIRIYDNKKKSDLQAWYDGHFSEKERLNCVMADSSVKIGTYGTKFTDPKTEPNECEADGHWALSPDSTKVVKVSTGEETTENINKILETFIFDGEEDKEED